MALIDKQASIPPLQLFDELFEGLPRFGTPSFFATTEIPIHGGLVTLYFPRKKISQNRKIKLATRTFRYPGTTSGCMVGFEAPITQEVRSKVGQRVMPINAIELIQGSESQDVRVITAADHNQFNYNSHCREIDLTDRRRIHLEPTIGDALTQQLIEWCYLTTINKVCQNRTQIFQLFSFIDQIEALVEGRKSPTVNI